MAIDLVKNTLKYTIFLGLIGLFIAWAFNLKNTFVETTIIDGQKILTFNWYNYIYSLNNSWSTRALDFDDILPTSVRQWDESASVWNWGGIFNNIAMVFDWLYFPINFMLYICRWMCWVLKLLLALIGWDFSIKLNQYNSNLVRILTWIIQELMIPYI